MDTSVRMLALDRYSGRLARITANYAVMVSACIGVLGAAAVLVADAVMWSPIVLSLAFGGFMFTYVRVRSRLRHSVLDFISQFPIRNGFASMALSYLGYTTRYVSERAIIVEGEVLMYSKSSLDADDITDALGIAAVHGIKSVVAIEGRFGTSHVTPKAREMMRYHGAMLLDLNCLFGAVHAKMLADGRRCATGM